jgi:predicted Zn-dependent protease
MGLYKGILFFGDLILMSVSREHEFMADGFASRCGYGEDLIDVLYQIHQVSIKQTGSVIEQLRSTHPPLTERIKRLERLGYKRIVQTVEQQTPKRKTKLSTMASASGLVISAVNQKSQSTQILSEQEIEIFNLRKEIIEAEKELNEILKKAELGKVRNPDILSAVTIDKKGHFVTCGFRWYNKQAGFCFTVSLQRSCKLWRQWYCPVC